MHLQAILISSIVCKLNTDEHPNYPSYLSVHIRNVIYKCFSDFHRDLKIIFCHVWYRQVPKSQASNTALVESYLSSYDLIICRHPFIDCGKYTIRSGFLYCRVCASICPQSRSSTNTIIARGSRDIVCLSSAIYNFPCSSALYEPKLAVSMIRSECLPTELAKSPQGNCRRAPSAFPAVFCGQMKGHS